MNFKDRDGITIVALIVTIIILLILAGISLAEFTGYGLFAKAQKAKLEAKRSAITEWLSIKLIEEQTNNPSGTAEEIIEATRENVIKNKEGLLEIGKKVEIEDIKDEEDGNKTEVYFYVIVDEDVYKVEQKGVKFIGGKNEFPPIIKITEVTNTTNTITVTVETQRNEGGKIEYYIKGENDTDYDLKDTKTEETYTYSGLEQNKKYNIKIVAIAKNKKTAEILVDRTTGSVPDLKDADIKFTYKVDGQIIDKDIWTNKNVTVTASTTVTGYMLQTSKDGKTWTSTESQTFTTNGIVYARLWDGTNYGGAASRNVTKIDTTPITISNLIGTASSTIATQATLSTTVNDANSGLSKIVWQWGTSTNYGSSATSTYIAMNGSDSGTTGSVTKTCELTGLSAGTTYYAKITVYDVAGNETTKTETFKTGTAVAQVGSTLYTSIKNAINTISTSGTVTMINSTTESPTIPSGKTITLELNSKTVTGTVSNNGTLNISGGTINGSSTENAFINKGTSVLTNVNINNDGVAIYNSGTCTFKSGNLVCTNGEKWTVFNTNGTFNIQGGTIQLTGSGSGTALISGGTGAKVNMSGGTIKSTIYGLVVDIGTAEVTGGSIQVTGTQPALHIRKQGSAIVKNATIQSTGTGEAVLNYLGYDNCIIRSRASNFGITGKIAGKVIATTNTSAGQAQETIKLFDVGYNYVMFPTWTNSNGQDDLKWYSVKVENSTASIAIKKSNHNNETGNYTVHIYSSDDGSSTKEQIFHSNNLLIF